MLFGILPVSLSQGELWTRPFRGCFSTGDGSTTFRLPDLRNLALRGVKGSFDDQRHHNHPGGFQRHEYESHNHRVQIQATTDAGTGAIADGAANGAGSGTDTDAKGGTETRMDNAGVFWCVYA